jgi:hypothetical protein
VDSSFRSCHVAQAGAKWVSGIKLGGREALTLWRQPWGQSTICCDVLGMLGFVVRPRAVLTGFVSHVHSRELSGKSLHTAAHNRAMNISTRAAPGRFVAHSPAQPPDAICVLLELGKRQPVSVGAEFACEGRQPNVNPLLAADE